MQPLPFYIVTLSHPRWEDALASAARLPPGTLPELRLDLFPDEDPMELVRALKGRCLVTCRKAEEGGRWEGPEHERMEKLLRAVEGRPAWLDLEWNLEIPVALRFALTRLRLVRSVHVPAGVFDLDERLRSLPEGDAYKWVGVASRLTDNARLKPALAFARDRGLLLSAFLMGPKGIPSRALQSVWGGSFTYAAPDDGPPAAPGQVAVSVLRSWRCHRLHSGHGLCGVMGSPVLHSRGPAYHNPRFQRAFKDLIYLPLECGDAEEAEEALETLGIVGASLTSPLKEHLPARLGFPGPLNTLWRRTPEDFWSCANTDATALEDLAARLPRGPVLILGAGGVARASARIFSEWGCPVLVATRAKPLAPGEVEAFRPVGVVQATSCGMNPGDGLPFEALLVAARPSLAWAVEWIYKEESAFGSWAIGQGLQLIPGEALFERQALAQSALFIEGCGT